MGASIKLEGAKELKAALLALPDKVATKVMDKALRKGGEMVLAEARFNAPFRNGALASGMTLSISNAHESATCTVGPGREQYYGQMLESGTKNKSVADRFYRGKKHGNTGDVRMKPHPFLLKSLENAHEPATAAIISELKIGIEREASRR